LSGGGGGGGGATTLDGLVDVDAPSPGAGQFLGYDGAIWKPIAIPNSSAIVRGLIELATQAEVDAGTDTERAVTPATLKQYVATASPPPPDATTAVKGIAQFADAAGVTAGLTDRVVTANLLKTTNDTLSTATTDITNLQTSVTTLQGQTVDATTTVKGIVQLADAAAIAAGTAGRVVDAAQLKAFTPADASETVKGIVELATTAEVLAGTDTVRAVTSKGLADNYLAKDISKLPALP
jgi:hypothetical protein